MKEERKKLTSLNLALVLVHDVLLRNGIQAGDGPVKQAVLRHKTRMHGEFQKIKIKRGVKSNVDLAQSGDPRAGGSILCTANLGSLSLVSFSPHTALCSRQHFRLVYRRGSGVLHLTRLLLR